MNKSCNTWSPRYISFSLVYILTLFCGTVTLYTFCKMVGIYESAGSNSSVGVIFESPMKTVAFKESIEELRKNTEGSFVILLMAPQNAHSIGSVVGSEVTKYYGEPDLGSTEERSIALSENGQVWLDTMYIDIYNSLHNPLHGISINNRNFTVAGASYYAGLDEQSIDLLGYVIDECATPVSITSDGIHTLPIYLPEQSEPFNYEVISGSQPTISGIAIPIVISAQDFLDLGLPVKAARIIYDNMPSSSDKEAMGTIFPDGTQIVQSRFQTSSPWEYWQNTYIQLVIQALLLLCAITVFWKSLPCLMGRRFKGVFIENKKLLLPLGLGLAICLGEIIFLGTWLKDKYQVFTNILVCFYLGTTIYIIITTSITIWKVCISSKRNELIS